MIHQLLSILAAFIASLAAIAVLIPIAKKVGWVDKPCLRKQHKEHTPHIGGLAIFIGFAFACLTQVHYLDAYRILLACGAILIFFGLVDDTIELSPRFRLIVQLVVALLMTSWASISILQFGNILNTGIVHLNNWSIPFTLLVVIGFINALNMIDGMDGLAGGVTLVSLVTLIILSIISGNTNAAETLSLLAASIAAFLCFNMRTPWLKSAKTFMGDAGSTFLGFALLWFCIQLSQSHKPAMQPVIVLWILAVPLFDFVSVFLRRLINRQSPLKADRQHIHHLLLRIGLSHTQTVYLIIGLSALFCLAGIAFQLFNVPEYITFFAFLVIFVIYMLSTLFIHNGYQQKESDNG